MKSVKYFLVLSAGVTSLSAISQDGAKPCQSEQAALASIESKYKPQYAVIESRGQALQKEAPSDGDKVNFDVKVDMKEQKWILKLPSVTMKRNEIVMGLPQTTMKLQTWSFDVPTSRMERRKTGQYPEFTCKKDNWGIPYDCGTTWSNTYADVPVVDMVRTSVKLDVPEVVWKNTRMSWDIPQLTWVENTWIVKVPEFTLVNVAVEKGKELKDKSGEISRDISVINSSRNSDSRLAMRAMYTCFRADIVRQQSLVEKQMDEGINSIDASIKSIRAQGADPTRLPSAGEQATDLVASLADMVAKRKAANESFSTAVAQLDAAEQEAVAKLQ